MSFLCSSCKNLWVILSGTTVLKGREQIGLSLESNSSKLVKGIDYFKERTCIDETKELEDLKNQDNSIPPVFVQKLSIALNISSGQAHELFLVYLAKEYTGSFKGINLMFSSEKFMETLIGKLWTFYYSERIYALFCMKQVLSNWHEGSDHPYQKTFQTFMTTANQNNVIFTSLLDQLEENLIADVPQRFSHSHVGHSPHTAESKTISWLRNNLKERFELLQLIYLAVGQIDPPTDQLVKLFGLINKHGGAKYQLSRQSQSHAQELNKLMYFISGLESLMLVYCMRLDLLDAWMEGDEIEELLEMTPKVKLLNQEVLHANSSNPANGILFLGWILVRRIWQDKEISIDSNQGAIAELSHDCLSLDVFKYLSEFVSCDLFVEAFDNGYMGKLVKGTIATLLSMFAVFFEIEELSDGKAVAAIFDTCKKLFREEQVSCRIFDESKSRGLMAILKCSLYTFPLGQISGLPSSLNIFLELGRSIVKTSAAVDFFSFMRTLNTFTEALDSCSHLVRPGPDGSVVCNQDRVACNGAVYIRRGDSGKVLSYNMQQNTTIISWDNLDASGWKILTHIYESKIETVSRVEHHHHVDEIYLSDITLINHLLADLISSSECLPPDLTRLVDLSLDGFKVFARSQPLARLYITSMLEMFSALSRFEPIDGGVDFWGLLEDLNLCPYMLGLNNEMQELITGQDTNASAIGELIISEECVFGDYQLCLSYLRFISNSLQNLKIDSRVVGSLLHIFVEIFPSYNRWQFNNFEHKDEIGLLCFEIANLTLSLKAKTKDELRIVDICMNTLLAGNPGEMLLKVIQGGKERVKKMIKTNGSSTLLTESKPIVMTRLSLSVLNQLLQLREKMIPKPKITTAVEQALFIITSSKPNMLMVLVNYVYQPYDSRLAVLGGQLLKCLARNFPMSMLACLGSEAEAVREHFLFKLDAVTEDVHVKVSLLDFLAVCVQHQPGLMELFVNSETEEDEEEEANGNGNSNESKTSCLITVLDILEEKKDGRFYCPIELHTAALRFVYTFWMQAHTLAIDSLKKNGQLWSLICFPLFEAENIEKIESDKSNCPLAAIVFRLLAREVFLVRTLQR